MLEDEAEMKNEIMQEKLEDLSNKIVSLSNTIQNRETDLEREDIQFLQAYKSYTDSVIYSPQDSNVLAPDSLIDVSKHVGNLKFKVWEKMLGQVQYTDYYIECYGEDFLMVRNMVLQCRSKVPQSCYTRATGEKGCVSVEFCKRKGWKCCNENRCNA
ncbi:zinc-binding A33-like protein [Labeo rohita]|uniref:Zinc-binding A33-like protein n=1 Tax=Labeo rohita TaxID=84645 RepID=A0A498MWC6_LABRO|nr:zinc-binding A33-like protein [Labeo rohita]